MGSRKPWGGLVFGLVAGWVMTAGSGRAWADCVCPVTSGSSGVADPGVAVATGTAAPATAAAASAHLAFTGFAASAFILIGLGVISVGAGLVLLSRHRTSTSTLRAIILAAVMFPLLLLGGQTAFAAGPSAVAVGAATVSAASSGCNCPTDPAATAPAANLPEVPMAVILPLIGVAGFGGWYLLRRRQNPPPPPER